MARWFVQAVLLVFAGVSSHSFASAKCDGVLKIRNVRPFDLARSHEYDRFYDADRGGLRVIVMGLSELGGTPFGSSEALQKNVGVLLKRLPLEPNQKRRLSMRLKRLGKRDALNAYYGASWRAAARIYDVLEALNGELSHSPQWRTHKITTRAQAETFIASLKRIVE